MRKALLGFFLLSTLAVAQPTISCVGTPGSTTGVYQQQCITAGKVTYYCSKVAGCTIAGDWTQSTFTNFKTGVSNRMADQLTYIAPGAGSTPQTVSADLQQRGFLATEYDTIQHAINAASGGDLIFPSGSYSCSGLTWGASTSITITLQPGADISLCLLPAQDATHTILDERNGSVIVPTVRSPIPAAISYGDSITYGVGAYPLPPNSSNEYVNLLSGMLNMNQPPALGSIINYGVSGAICGDEAALALGTTTVPNAIYTYALGANDSFWYQGKSASQANALQAFQECTQSEIVWLALPTTNKVAASDSRMTYTGAWFSDTSFYPFVDMWVAGAGTATATVYGSTVYVSSLWAAGSSGINGALTVTIDGGTPSTSYSMLSPMGADVITTALGKTIVPWLVRFPGLTPGPHTVVVTANGSANTYLNYIAGSGGADAPGQMVYLLSELPKSATVMTGQGDSIANIAAYNAAIRSTALSLDQDGLNVIYVDDWPLLSPGISGTVNTNGTAVSWASGTNFASVSNGDTFTIAFVPYTVLTKNSNISITLTSSAGTQTGATFGTGGNLADGLHPNNSGHAKIAAAVANAANVLAGAHRLLSISASTDLIDSANLLRVGGVPNATTSTYGIVKTTTSSATVISSNDSILTTIPTVYGYNGTAISTPHTVVGVTTITGGGNVTITLSSAAVYTSSGSYVCSISTGAHAAYLTQGSGSQFTITGTAADVVEYICIGD